MKDQFGRELKLGDMVVFCGIRHRSAYLYRGIIEKVEGKSLTIFCGDRESSRKRFNRHCEDVSLDR
jgi:hypothetical protein